MFTWESASRDVTPGNATLRQPGALVVDATGQLREIAPHSQTVTRRTGPALAAGMLAFLALVIVSSTPCPPGEMLEGGMHRRLETSRGAVHLWCRGEFDSVVFYVHGYRDTVDSAFTGHALAAQFSRSQVPALFVAVAAPSGPNEKVVFDDLDALVKELPVSVPEKTILIGHSGGNRTLKAWLRSSRANDVVLLDGFYGDASAWTRWLTARPDATLRMVGQHTWARAEQWRTQLPKPLRERVSHRPSRATHMEIVTAGKWIPRMLGAEDDS